MKEGVKGKRGGAVYFGGSFDVLGVAADEGGLLVV